MRAVYRFYKEGVWDLDLNRPLDENEYNEWSDIMELLETVQLQDHPDQVKWVYEKSGIFSTRSMYRLMTFRGVTNRRTKRLWGSRLPLKLKVFMWLADQDRLQTGVALKKKKWKGDHRCIICRVQETVDHIFFECHQARFIWISFKEALGWEKIPDTMQDMLESWLPLSSPQCSFKLFCSTIIFWALWTFRNKMAIENVLVSDPANIIFKILSYLQRW